MGWAIRRRGSDCVPVADATGPRDLCRLLATLDAILSPDWEAGITPLACVAG